MPRLTRNADEPRQWYATFVTMSNFREKAQVETPYEVFVMLISAEERFLECQEIVSKLQVDIHDFLWEKMQDIAKIDGFPSCHDILARLIKRFIRMRTWMLGEKPSDVKRLTRPSSQQDYVLLPRKSECSATNYPVS